MLNNSSNTIYFINFRSCKL